MTGDEIVVTGLGMVTPAGVGSEATWEGVCKGLSAAMPDPRLAGLPVDFSCQIQGFQAADHIGGRAAWRMDRCSQLAVAAAREAVRDAGLTPAAWDADRVGVVIGTGIGGQLTCEDEHGKLLSEGHESVSPTVVPKIIPNMPAADVAIALRARGASMSVSTACASGATAIIRGRHLLDSDSCDVAIVGGADAAVTRLITTGFARMGVLSRRLDAPELASRPFDADRDGFVLGEGAAVLVLERLRTAQQRGATVRAVLAGCGETNDAYHVTAPHPEQRGAETAVRLALADAGAVPRQVGHVNAHGTSTRVNDAAEAALLARVFPQAPPVTSAKGALGHCLGASGAVEAALTVLTLQRQVIPPTANLDTADPEFELDLVSGRAREHEVELALSNAFGFGGHNVVLAFRRHA
jgi:3-oxoacyl-[acyl-carrier-protein] synthase II